MEDDRHDWTARSVILLLRIPDAAKLLSIGRSTVYELISDGHLDTVHIGRAVRVTTASVEAFVDRQRSQARRTRNTPPESGSPSRISRTPR